MGAKFDEETITLTRGQGVMELLLEAFKKKRIADRIEDGIFILDDVTVLSIDGNDVVCRVRYEYEVE